MSYKKLEVWQLARQLSIDIHEMSLNLPKFEMYEEDQQIRRSSKTIRSTIVEGYGRRYYKQEFVKYVIYALSSNDETMDHLETLFETKSLTDEILFIKLQLQIEELGKKLNKFLQAIQTDHKSPK